MWSTTQQSIPSPEGVPEPVLDDRSLPPTRGGAPVNLPEIGDRVGRYVLEHRVGEGGMGVVWRAWDPEVGRRVAIKLVRTGGSADPKLYARLRREARALARVHHPGVVSLFDMGRTQAGSFLALEFVSGTHLRRWLAHGIRTPSQIVGVIAQAARALAAVHRAGVVHRDVKPTNILVADDGRVVIVDFGLALGVGDSEGSRSSGECDDPLLCARLTKTNMVVGTTSYMSPEQLLGRDVDERSDLFALAVTATEALAGRRPWSASTPYELAVAYESRAVPDLAGLERCSRAVRTALARALALDPAARFADGDAFAAALFGGPPPPPLRRHLVAVLAVGSLLASGVAWAAADGVARELSEGIGTHTVAIPDAAVP